ncbi:MULTISPECIES: cytochrome P450 [Streptomyces]|uniref:Cytochrome P450 n=1 Tax=Streptomyces thermoviolaceus subsp. thermoviolaceus TaxID=66860 RepID=A0ABX0YPT8_STRTL|nr:MULTISPECIES: cytochrome P450 [Streptomyces]MCM3262578.1 cytochrome P450 [Streptomyces thermoviolaceus]NJP14002.1 cytochrome P450 [Streptomyces thermoviolaceus subsp. thermoviolaceus]RSR97146.1 cytochrome P450 [Streptomyces sp. WAC00469]WTD50357.1 cytochrome P450 [Streptomyces thermoviolaceus]GGV63598.1 biflaviolin synthase CYP158A1 [Streptomyces thermoviolaceus subsp. apingens]
MTQEITPPSPAPVAPPPVRDWPALDLEGTVFDPVLAELMREGPLTRVRLPYGEGWAWLATRWDDVKLITNDPRFSRAEVTRRQVTRMAPNFAPRPGSLAWADQPDHNRLRKPVAGAFTVSAVKRLRPRAQEILDELVDGLLRDGPPADLVARVLEPFPLGVVCEVMGVPAEDRPRVRAWTREIVSTNGAEAAGRAKDALYGWITATVRARADGAGEDVYAMLGRAVANGEISEEEAVGLAGPLQIGGEAVTHNCGQMLFLLLTRPELMARMRERPEERGAVLDELLRWIPHRSSVGLARIALEDVELHGIRIAAGDPVYVSYLAANRDPDVFPDPDVIDPDRDAGAHLAFGNGPHYCTGAVLARLLAELLTGTLLDRLPGLRLAVPPEQVAWRRRTMIRGPRTLPVAW